MKLHGITAQHEGPHHLARGPETWRRCCQRRWYKQFGQARRAPFKHLWQHNLQQQQSIITYGCLWNRLTEQLANLEIGVEFKLDLRSEDLEPVHELGHGNGGTVALVRHIPTSAIMARKVCCCALVVLANQSKVPDTSVWSQVVHIDAKPSVRKQILRELQIMHDCVSRF